MQIGWSSEDEQELVKNIRQFTSKSDKLKYSTRVQRLDWGKVAFKKHTPAECQERFAKYLKMVRNYRTLHEILSDVEEEIKRIPFKKPLNSYQLFVQDQLSKAQSSGDFVSISSSMRIVVADINWIFVCSSTVEKNEELGQFVQEPNAQRTWKIWQQIEGGTQRIFKKENGISVSRCLMDEQRIEFVL